MCSNVLHLGLCDGRVVAVDDDVEVVDDVVEVVGDVPRYPLTSLLTTAIALQKMSGSKSKHAITSRVLSPA